jgi:hypothetical protein
MNEGCKVVGVSTLCVQVLMNWSQEELEQWTATQRQKEEDNAAIERYRAQDSVKIKELDLAIERMNRSVASKRAELEKEVTETQSAQMQLQKAADDFARLHKVRARALRLKASSGCELRRMHVLSSYASSVKGEVGHEERYRWLVRSILFISCLALSLHLKGEGR